MNHPLGMPEDAVHIGKTLWSIIIPSEDWISETVYIPNPNNRNWKTAYKKIPKDHLRFKGELMDQDLRVDAALDDEGVLWKMDGHCRSGAWGEKAMTVPDHVICTIHVLPEKEKIDGEYAKVLLERIENKKGKRSSTEDKDVANKRTSHLLNPRSWFVKDILGKTALNGAVTVAETKTWATKILPPHSKDLSENLANFVGARVLADSFDWVKPHAPRGSSEEVKEEVKKLLNTFSSSMGSVFIVSFYYNEEACRAYWSSWGTSNMNALQQETYEAYKNSTGLTTQNRVNLAIREMDNVKKWMDQYYPKQGN